MSYTAPAVANELLELANSCDRRLTQIDIQKLVYFAHGWYLALTKEPLIDEAILAWKYGPVVRSLYDEFREFGSSPITSLAKEWAINEKSEFIYQVAELESGNDEQDLYTKALVGTVWDKYGTLSSFKLVEITHLPGSPWAEAVSAGERFIDNDRIQTYFERLASEGTAA